ncbi:E3 ubiquitin-protein ligase RNF168 [Xyrichtys novacula]|uniref:RING-type E3 ubiquitin transferase n=1 Tax=Xyrichtys novacula TaxID=13765 RepID=A0AAV1G144_XYRNO|nr:E3 ubiquitin-protein ligase RNF168 [Xyrichtys novacula]
MAPVSDVEVEVEVSEKKGVLCLDDCYCPVCLEIFKEPVTLPCTHTFCKECFLQAVDQSSLLCPLCRRRIAVWCRQNSRNNTLINQQLWTRIQETFPKQCERRLRGQDVQEDNPPVSVCFPRVSEPGALRQEYEEQVTRLTEERRVLEEEERRASEELIKTLLAKEEEELQEDTKRREEDERLARLLSNQWNSAAVSERDVGPADVSSVNAKKGVCSGQIERFFSRPSQGSSDYSSTANKENMALCEQVKPPPPSLSSWLTTGGGALCPKRKSGEMGPPEEQEEGEREVITTKRVCVSSSSSSALHTLAECEAELLSRRQQEEEDRRLAMLLQKELNQEERLRATDRRKGTSDAYLFRHSRRDRCNEQDPRKTGHSSSSSSSSSSTFSSSSSSSSSSSLSSSRGSKQKTLTEMFSTLNN